jgi:hypothetical protein
MSTKVSTRFYLISLLINSNFITFHNFLNSCSYIFKPYIDSCCLNTSISCILSCQKKIIKLRLECNSKSTIYNPSFYLSTKVYLAYIIFSNDSVISIVRSVMSSHMVKRTSSRKSYPCIQSILTYKISIHFFYFCTNVN